MKVKIRNRLDILLRQRKITSASEFARRMTDAGFAMSSSNATRYVKEAPPSFDLKFLDVACNVLQVLPNEFYEITIELEPDEGLPTLVTLPQHAIILRRDKTLDGEIPQGSAPSQPASDAVAPVATKPNKQKASGKDNQADIEATGPSGLVFPFRED